MNSNGSLFVDGFLKPNQTEATEQDLFSKFMVHQQHELILYRALACTIGSLLIVSNLIVVVSSGLILKKCSRCKSTILLLGNVSLADTLIGSNIIYVNISSHYVYSDAMCIFLIGLIVTPTLVSVLSVGLIAVDRYIYILHGLYYRRWINTTRVRISIMLTWLLGIMLGFMPATGWAEDSMGGRKCWYLAVAPPGLITLIAVIGFLPVALVCILYSIVLHRALRNVNQLKNTDNSINKEAALRINRGKTPQNKSHDDAASSVNNISTVSATIENGTYLGSNDNTRKLNKDLVNNSGTVVNDTEKRTPQNKTTSHDDAASSVNRISTLSAAIENGTNLGSNDNTRKLNKDLVNNSGTAVNDTEKRKSVEPNKWRAIKVVFFTTGSLVCTWVPYFIGTIMYILCDKETEEERCLNIELALTRPLANLALLNSLLNPLIYAWWHKGFNMGVRKIFWEFRTNFFCFIKTSKSCINS